MIDLFDFYRTYGQSLATRIDADQPQFIFVEDMGDPAEVLSFLNGKASDSARPITVLEQFQEVLDTGGRDNFHTEINGSLSILLKGLDRESKRVAQATARKLLLQAVAQMLADSETGTLLEENIRFEVRKLPLTPIGPIGGKWYGYGVEFSWLVPVDLTPTN